MSSTDPSGARLARHRQRHQRHQRHHRHRRRQRRLRRRARHRHLRRVSAAMVVVLAVVKEDGVEQARQTAKETATGSGAHNLRQRWMPFRWLCDHTLLFICTV